MTALLISGTKNKEHLPTSKMEEREAKRKVSEPCIDVSFLEKDKSPSVAVEKNRTGDISQFELSMTAVSFEITVTRTTMDRIFELSQKKKKKKEKKKNKKINDSSEFRDHGYENDNGQDIRDILSHEY